MRRRVQVSGVPELVLGYGHVERTAVGTRGVGLTVMARRQRRDHRWLEAVDSHRTSHPNEPGRDPPSEALSRAAGGQALRNRRSN